MDEGGRRPLVVLGAAVPAALIAALVDGAMAGAGLLHVTGLVLATAFPLGIAGARVAAAAPATPVLRARGAAFVRWFSGPEGASRLLAVAASLVAFLALWAATTEWLVANHQRAGLITLAALAAGVGEGLLCLAFIPALATLWRFLLRLIGDPSPVAAALVLGALLGGWMARVSLAGPPEAPPDLRLLVVLAAFLIVQVLATLLLARLRQAAAFAAVVAGVVCTLVLVPFTALDLGSDRAVLAAVAERSACSSRVLRLLRAWSDGDEDGYSPLFGGGDCDDRDRAVHPGASDPVADGLDLDCDGAD